VGVINAPFQEAGVRDFAGEAQADKAYRLFETQTTGKGAFLM